MWWPVVPRPKSASAKGELMRHPSAPPSPPRGTLSLTLAPTIATPVNAPLCDGSSLQNFDDASYVASAILSANYFFAVIRAMLSHTVLDLVGCAGHDMFALTLQRDDGGEWFSSQPIPELRRHGFRPSAESRRREWSLLSSRSNMQLTCGVIGAVRWPPRLWAENPGRGPRLSRIIFSCCRCQPWLLFCKHRRRMRG